MVSLQTVNAVLDKLAQFAPNDDIAVGIDIYRRNWILKSTAAPDIRRGYAYAEDIVNALDAAA